MPSETSGSRLPLTGGCVCGAIRCQVTSPPLGVYACHCTDCQTQSASAFSLAMPVACEHFRITQGTLRAWQRPAPSGEVVTSWSCPQCACRIYGERPSRARAVNLRVGTLDDTSWVEDVVHVWTSSAQPWMRFGSGAITHPTQPVDFRVFVAEARRKRSPAAGDA
jgi:hypothetical protein